MIFGLKGFIKFPEYRVDKSIAIDYVLESYMIDSRYNIPAKNITEYFSKGITDKLNEIVQHIIKFAKTGKLEIDKTRDIIWPLSAKIWKNGNTIKEFGIYNGSWFDVEEWLNDRDFKWC